MDKATTKRVLAQWIRTSGLDTTIVEGKLYNQVEVRQEKGVVPAVKGNKVNSWPGHLRVLRWSTGNHEEEHSVSNR